MNAFNFKLKISIKLLKIKIKKNSFRLIKNTNKFIVEEKVSPNNNLINKDTKLQFPISVLVHCPEENQLAYKVF